MPKVKGSKGASSLKLKSSGNGDKQQKISFFFESKPAGRNETQLFSKVTSGEPFSKTVQQLRCAKSVTAASTNPAMSGPSKPKVIQSLDDDDVVIIDSTCEGTEDLLALNKNLKSSIIAVPVQSNSKHVVNKGVLGQNSKLKGVMTNGECALAEPSEVGKDLELKSNSDLSVNAAKTGTYREENESDKCSANDASIEENIDILPVTPKKTRALETDGLDSSPDIIFETPKAEEPSLPKAKKKLLSNRSFLRSAHLLAVQPGLKPAHQRGGRWGRKESQSGQVSVSFHGVGKEKDLTEHIQTESNYSALSLSVPEASTIPSAIDLGNFKASNKQQSDSVSIPSVPVASTSCNDAAESFTAPSKSAKTEKKSELESLACNNVNKSLGYGCSIKEGQNLSLKLQNDPVSENKLFHNNVSENLIFSNDILTKPTSCSAASVIKKGQPCTYHSEWNSQAVREAVLEDTQFSGSTGTPVLGLSMEESSSSSPVSNEKDGQKGSSKSLNTETGRIVTSYGTGRSKLLSALERDAEREGEKKDEMWLTETLIKLASDVADVPKQKDVLGRTGVILGLPRPASFGGGVGKRSSVPGLSPKAKRLRKFTKIKSSSDKEMSELKKKLDLMEDVVEETKHSVKSKKERMQKFGWREKEKVADEKVSLENDELLSEMLGQLSESTSKISSVGKKLKPCSLKSPGPLSSKENILSDPTLSQTKRYLNQKDVEIMEEALKQMEEEKKAEIEKSGVKKSLNFDLDPITKQNEDSVDPLLLNFDDTDSFNQAESITSGNTEIVGSLNVGLNATNSLDSGGEDCPIVVDSGLTQNFEQVIDSECIEIMDVDSENQSGTEENESTSNHHDIIILEPSETIVENGCVNSVEETIISRENKTKSKVMGENAKLESDQGCENNRNIMGSERKVKEDSAEVVEKMKCEESSPDTLGTMASKSGAKKGEDEVTNQGLSKNSLEVSEVKGKSKEGKDNRELFHDAEGEEISDSIAAMFGLEQQAKFEITTGYVLDSPAPIAGKDKEGEKLSIDGGNSSSEQRNADQEMSNSIAAMLSIVSEREDQETKSKVEKELPCSSTGKHDDEEMSDSIAAMLSESFNELSPFKTPKIHVREKPKKEFCFTDLWQRFTVKAVQHDKRSGEVHLDLTKAGTDETCQYKATLQGFWADTVVEDGDIVNVIGHFEDGRCTISDKNGLIVVNPDLLLSGTLVVSTVFCARKSVLNEKFKGVDTGNLHMLYGSIIHSLFQSVLKQKLTQVNEVRLEAQSLIHTKKFLHEMYGQNVSEKTVTEEIEQYLSTLTDWVDKHMQIPGKSARSDSELIVTEIQDIEENIWSPRLGLKGKIDLTVKTKLKRRGGVEEKVLPLELKTGKASFSAEHKGQVTLYSMMYEDRRESPDEGILLYLKHGQMEAVPVRPHSKSGLIQRRNEMAQYLSDHHSVERDEEGQAQVTLSSLPSPINSERFCSKCPQLLNCAVFQKSNKNVTLPPSHPMSRLVPEALGHLTEIDISYFLHWSVCLSLEEQESKRSQLSAIWTMSSQHRESRGECLSNLVIWSSELGIPESQGFTEGKGCSLTFVRSPRHSTAGPLHTVGLVSGEMVVVSSQDGRYIALTTGFIRAISEHSVEVVVDRDHLEDTSQYEGLLFRLDRNESFSTSGQLNSNLTRLMQATAQATRLRNLILGAQKPETELKLPKSDILKVKPIFKSLNKAQRAALLKVLMSKDFVLIKGYPGTGKTSTIVALVKILQLLGKSVLLASYTHSAVDNILLKLKQDGMRFLRLGRQGRIHPSILSHSAEVLTNSPDINSVDKLTEFYNSYDIVATSCLGTSHPMFSRRQFDVCVVDEASQVLQPACLGPLFYARKFVLVGDSQQLPPVVQSKEARRMGMDESLFSKLDNRGATYELNVQYRMNKMIMSLANALVYNGCLECGSSEIAKQTMSLDAELIKNHPDWMQRALSSDLDQSIVFLNLPKESAPEQQECKGYRNEKEAEIVTELLQALIDARVKSDDIGVISPYRSQVALLRQVLRGHVTGVEVNTVDQYQGRDKSVIIVSFVRSNGEVGELLRDLRRLNVSITRAKHKLILIGNVETLEREEPFMSLLAHIQKAGNIVNISS